MSPERLRNFFSRASRNSHETKEKSSDSNSNFYVTFGTRDKTGESTGKKYGFGSQEILNRMK